jgi:hypothetical protein
LAIVDKRIEFLIVPVMAGGILELQCEMPSRGDTSLGDYYSLWVEISPDNSIFASVERSVILVDRK